jgi:hypothetical protein
MRMRQAPRAAAARAACKPRTRPPQQRTRTQARPPGCLARPRRTRWRACRSGTSPARCLHAGRTSGWREWRQARGAGRLWAGAAHATPDSSRGAGWAQCARWLACVVCSPVVVWATAAVAAVAAQRALRPGVLGGVVCMRGVQASCRVHAGHTCRRTSPRCPCQQRPVAGWPWPPERPPAGSSLRGCWPWCWSSAGARPVAGVCGARRWRLLAGSVVGCADDCQAGGWSVGLAATTTP